MATTEKWFRWERDISDIQTSEAGRMNQRLKCGSKATRNVDPRDGILTPPRSIERELLNSKIFPVQPFKDDHDIFAIEEGYDSMKVRVKAVVKYIVAVKGEVFDVSTDPA